MYRARGDEPRYHEQLPRSSRATPAAGAERTDRTRYLAAQAGLVLAEPLYAAFDACSSCSRSSRTSKRKRELMDAAMQAFESLDRLRGRRGHDRRHVLHGRDLLELQPFAARFGAARRTSMPPSCAEYEDALEEQAFPFEERAIEVHEANVDVMIAAGVYNRWVEQSFARLAVLVPGPLREAKSRASASLGAIDDVHVLAHRAPSSPRRRAERRPREPERATHARAAAPERADASELDVLAGAGFTITDAARVDPRVARALPATAHRLSLEQGLRTSAASRELERRDEASSRSSANPHVRSRRRIRPHAADLARGRTRASSEPSRVERRLIRSRTTSSPWCTASRPFRRRARELRASARDLSRISISRTAISRSSATCISTTTRARCATTRRIERAVPDDAQVAIWIADIKSRSGT